MIALIACLVMFAAPILTTAIVEAVERAIIRGARRRREGR